jgi:hypothetical protein
MYSNSTNYQHSVRSVHRLVFAKSSLLRDVTKKILTQQLRLHLYTLNAHTLAVILACVLGAGSVRAGDTSKIISGPSSISSMTLASTGTPKTLSTSEAEATNQILAKAQSDLGTFIKYAESFRAEGRAADIQNLTQHFAIPYINMIVAPRINSEQNLTDIATRQLTIELSVATAELYYVLGLSTQAQVVLDRLRTRFTDSINLAISYDREKITLAQAIARAELSQESGLHVGGLKK